MDARHKIDSPLHPTGAGSADQTQLNRGRVKFFAMVAVLILIELSVFDASVTTFARLLLTCGMLFATWVGHGWARVTLIACYGLGSLLVMLALAEGHDLPGGALTLVLIGLALLTFCLSAAMLQFSTDLRSYLEVEKFPRPTESRDEERDG